jgi:hypothetical protein
MEASVGIYITRKDEIKGSIPVHGFDGKLTKTFRYSKRSENQ